MLHTIPNWMRIMVFVTGAAPSARPRQAHTPIEFEAVHEVAYAA
jgi:hypothetical protein